MIEEAITILRTEPSRDTLLAWVRHLDWHCGSDTDLWSIPRQLVAQSTLALGNLLLESIAQGTPMEERINTTMMALRSLVDASSEEKHSAYFRAATASYPFGAGEGCFAISELGVEQCGRGSGCRSGAGTLLCFPVDEPKLMSEIARDILPYLEQLAS